MAITITKPDDTALSGLSFTAERGVPSAHIPIKIKNTGLLDVVAPFLVFYAENTPGSGIYVTTGQPVVDERMGRFQITGVDSSGTPGQEALIGIVQPLGHFAVAQLPTIKPGNAILADVWLEQATSSAGGGSVNVKFEVANEQGAFPLPAGVSMVGTGIDSGLNQPKSYLVSGRAVTATGTPNDQIHVAPGSWLIGGVLYSDATTQDITFNQVDVNAATLAAGESYKAAVTQGVGATPTVTKGAKGTSPATPNIPAGELLLAYVTVVQGGSTVIQTSNIVSDLTYGRYLVTAPATGLTVTVHAGEAVIANYRTLHPVKETVAVTASSTNRIWLQSNGAITVTQSDTPPSPGAIKLATAVTNTTQVTTLTDTRTYIGAAGALTPHAASHATAGSDPVSPASIGAALASDLAAKAPLASPALTGTPTVPTAAAGTNTTQAASTAFVQAAWIDRVQVFAGDGVAQPSALSPAPAAGNLPMVFKNGLLLEEGAGKDYTFASPQVTLTPVAAAGAKVITRWRTTT